MRSLRGVLAETAPVGAVSVALGLLAFASLRSVPLRLLRQALEHATHLATHDPLTGLANRTLLREHLADALAEARKEGWAVAALLVDLDRFKPVNDVHGHLAATGCCRRWRGASRRARRGSDLCARLGGDEFAVVARFGAEDEDALRETAARLAGRVVAALEAPFPLGRRRRGVQIGLQRRRGLAPRREPTSRRARCSTGPTPPCTAPRRKAAAASASSKPAWTNACASAPPSRRSCGPTCSPTRWSRTSSRWWTSAPAASSASRCSRAGGTPGLGQVPPAEFVPVAEERA